MARVAQEVQMDPVELVGRLVSGRVPERPQKARGLLEAAYGFVAAKGALTRGVDVPSLRDRCNGAVARSIVRSLRHPEGACMVNIYQPCELLHALDVTPMFPEGIAVYVACTRCAEVFCGHAEACGVPESFCSYHKLMLGMTEAQVLPVPPLVAHTTLACDANQVSFRRLAQRGGARRLVVDVPQATDEEAVAYVARQLRGLARELEGLCGRSLDQDRLRSVCATAHETLASAARLLALRSQATLPSDLTAELCAMVCTHCLLGTPEALAYLRGLEAAACTAPAPRPDVPRVYWYHTLPNWQPSMGRLFDGAVQAELVGNEMAFDAVHLLDQLDPADPFDFMARRLVRCTGNGSARRRAQAAAAQALRAGADGGVLFAHWGCKQTQGQASLAREAFEEKNLPLLVLDGDGCDPRNAADGQMVTRCQAFLEQLRAAKVRAGAA